MRKIKRKKFDEEMNTEKRRKSIDRTKVLYESAPSNEEYVTILAWHEPKWFQLLILFALKPLNFVLVFCLHKTQLKHDLARQ